MPGNDFLAVVLSKLTQKNWLDFFDMYGLHITDQTKNHILAQNYASSIPKKMYVLEDNLPGADILQGLSLLDMADTDWPLDTSKHPKNCP